MGIRMMDQWIGLSPTAEVFLQENCRKTKVEVCPTCKHQTGGEFITENYSKTSGMFDSEYTSLSLVFWTHNVYCTSLF